MKMLLGGEGRGHGGGEAETEEEVSGTADYSQRISRHFSGYSLR
jgi:hypothetical protein